MAKEDRKLLRDFAMPQVEEIQSSINRPAIHATSFEIKPATIQMIQNTVQFGGLPNDDPNDHLMSFLEICDTFKYDGVSDDAIRLRLFPFTLRDKARSWLHTLPPGSITTWNDLAQKFLAKFFPPAKTAKRRNDITSFRQHDSESLYEAWERFKELLRRCPHHGIPKWLQVQTFYNGLLSTTRTTIDAAAGGALMAKTVDEAYNLLETMAANEYQWPSEKVNQSRVAGVYETDPVTAMAAQLATLMKTVESLAKTRQPIQPMVMNCDLCAGNHSVSKCPINAESVQYIASYDQQHQSINSSYYPPNHSQSNKQDQSYVPRPSYQPGFQNQPQPQPEKESHLEEILTRFMTATEIKLKDQDKYMSQNEVRMNSLETSMRNLENQVGQIASAINSRSQGALPSNTEINPRREGKEHCNAVTLRSGKELHKVDRENSKKANPEMDDDSEAERENIQNGPHKHKEDDKAESSTNSKQRQIVPPVPFPQRLQKNKLDKQF